VMGTHHHHITFYWLRWGLANFCLPKLASNFGPLLLFLPHYRHEPLCPTENIQFLRILMKILVKIKFLWHYFSTQFQIFTTTIALFLNTHGHVYVQTHMCTYIYTCTVLQLYLEKLNISQGYLRLYRI
jgi:hypothetical protein